MICTSPLIFFRLIKSRRMRWAGHVARMGKPEVKGPLWRHRGRWVDNIKKDIHVVECRGMDWIELDQYSDRWHAFVNGVMNVQVKLHGRIS